MKSILLSLFIILSLSQVRASDTLTIRQVFNFNVGDTFDYESYEYVTFGNGNTYSTNLAYSNCRRVFISEKFYSQDSSTLYYINCTIANSWYNGGCDTVKYNSLDSLIISYDTIIPWQDSSITAYGLYYSSDTLNSSNLYTAKGITIQNTYQAGLGQTYSLQTSGGFDDPFSIGNQNGSILTYYSNDSVHWGTPCNILLSVRNIGNIVTIKISPNPTTDQFHLSISDMNGADYRLILTDILGQEVYTSSVTQSESTHNVSNLSPGMYTWRLISPETPKGGFNTTICGGKIIRE